MLFKPPGSSRRSFCTLTFEPAGRFKPQPRQEQPGISGTNVPCTPGQPVPRSLQEITSGPGGRFEPSLLSPPTPALLPASATGISSLSRLPSPSQGSGYQLSEAPVGAARCWRARPYRSGSWPALPAPTAPARARSPRQLGSPLARQAGDSSFGTHPLATSPHPHPGLHPRVTRSWHTF